MTPVCCIHEDHARRTSEEWRDSYGIPSRTRKITGPGDGQSVYFVSEGSGLVFLLSPM